MDDDPLEPLPNVTVKHDAPLEPLSDEPLEPLPDKSSSLGKSKRSAGAGMYGPVPGAPDYSGSMTYNPPKHTDALADVMEPAVNAVDAVGKFSTGPVSDYMNRAFGMVANPITHVLDAPFDKSKAVEGNPLEQIAGNFGNAIRAGDISGTLMQPVDAAINYFKGIPQPDDPTALQHRNFSPKFYGEPVAPTSIGKVFNDWSLQDFADMGTKRPEAANWIGAPRDKAGNLLPPETPEEYAKRTSAFGPDGKLDPYRAALNAADLGRDFYAMGKLMPEVKLGVNPAGKAAAAAAREAIRKGELTGAPTLEAAKATVPSFSDQVRAGNVGVQFPLPGIDEPAFMAAPKWLEGPAKLLNPISKALNATILGPDASSPLEVLRKQYEGLNLNEVNEKILRPRYEIAQRLKKIGATPEDVTAIKAITENLDTEGKLGVQLKEGEQYPVGVDVQSGHPAELQESFERLKANEPEVAGTAKEAFEAGLNHKQAVIREAMDHFATLEPEQQAAYYAAAKDIHKLAATEEQMFRDKGMEPNTLNAVEKAKYPALLDEHAKLVDEKAGTSEAKRKTAIDKRLAEIEKEIPIAAKQYNAVSSYVPSVVDTGAREGIGKGANKNLAKARTTSDPETSQRGVRVKDLSRENADLGDVKASSTATEKQIKYGTAANAGEATGEALDEMRAYKPLSWQDRVLTPEGRAEYFKGFGDAQSKTYFRDVLDAWNAKGKADIKAMTNFDLQKHYTKMMDQMPRATVDAITQAIFDGKTGDGSGVGERALARPGEVASNEYTMPELEKMWTESGRKDTFRQNMNAAQRAAIDAGRPIKEVITKAWVPEGRVEWTPKGEKTSTFMDKNAFNELDAYQKLGTDPTAITAWMRKNAPAYQAFVKMQKGLSTLFGPGAPGYVMLKLAHDLVRGEVGKAWDGQSAGELVSNIAGHWKYAESGGMDASGIGEYDFGPRGKLSGKAAAELLEKAQAMGHAGEITQEFQDPETVTQSAKKAYQLPAQKLENFVKAQDTNMRSAALASYMRQGMSLDEAAFRVQKSFFDFSQKGPVTQVLSQTGVVPFAAWTTKIVPFMLEWALTKPGEFALVNHTLNKLKAGAIPADQVPQMIRHGTNMPVNVFEDKDGHLQVQMVTDNGVIPGNELKEIFSAPGSTALGKLGPVLRGLHVAWKNADQDAKDPTKLTAGDEAQSAAKTMIGRAASIGQTLFDPDKSALDKLSAVANPMSYQQFDWTKQTTQSALSARKAVKDAELAVGRSQGNVDKAKDAVLEAHKELTQQDALGFLPTDDSYRKAQMEMQAAQEWLKRATEQAKTTTRNHATTEKFLRSMIKTK